MSITAITLLPVSAIVWGSNFVNWSGASASKKPGMFALPRRGSSRGGCGARVVGVPLDVVVELVEDGGNVAPAKGFVHLLYGVDVAHVRSPRVLAVLDEGGKSRCHIVRVLDLKQMGSFRQDEWFRVGEPVEYALMDLRVDLQANTLPGVGAQHREDGLVNAFSLLPGE